MRERVGALLADAGRRDAAKALRISTFHSLGLSIIRGDAKALGLKPGFSILDPDDIEPIVAELIATTDRARARKAQWKISQWKNALVAPAAAAKAASSDDEAVAASAYARYDDTLRAYQAVDFDDLIALPIALLERDEAAAARWRERCGHLLVDEYQDTNAAQYRLLRLLAGERARFTAVGDDDQAIYGWRGASVENLAQLPVDYPALKVVKLEQNYRSTVRILRSANALIANNPKLFEKKLWSEHGPGDALRVTPAADDEAEAEGVVRRLLAHKFEHRGELVRLRDPLPRQPPGEAVRAGAADAERPVPRVRRRVVVRPRRDQGPDRLPAADRQRRRRPGVHPRGRRAEARHRRDHAREARGDRRVAPREPVRRGVRRRRRDGRAIPPRQREILDAFCTLINGLRYRAEREPAGRLLDELVAAIGYEDYLVATCDRKQAEARMQSVRDFTRWLATKGETDGKTLVELTQMIALITMLEGREGDDPDAVRLSTLHAAKGLEFPHVFLVGLEEGLLPHREAVALGNVDEERRLMYVGVTRAQRSLHLSFCRARKRAGEKVDCQPSRFLAELAQDDLRWAGAALPADEAAKEKDAGRARLAQLKAMLAR